MNPANDLANIAMVASSAVTSSNVTSSHGKGGQRTSFEELLRRAQALAPILRTRAEDTERNRRVPSETIQMVRDAELFKLMQPARFGGFEYGFSELVEINFELARGCGSSAWCASLGIVHQWLLALFPIQAQEDVWANPDAILSGSYAPVGKARAAEGGYMVSGKWSFTSNCDNTEWYLLGVTFPPEKEGVRPDAGFVIVPREQAAIEDDWFTVGLAGTGSKSVVIKDEVFVPTHRRITFAQASSNNPPGAQVHSNPLYKIPLLAGLPVCICTPALGMVQGAIDDFVAWIGTRTTRGAVAGGGARMAEFPQVQSRIAEAAAAVDAAKLLLLRDTRDIEQDAANGRPISIDKRIRNRRDHAYAVKLSTQGVTALFEAVGGGGINMSNSVQRAWRDVHAVARHISLNWDAVSTMYGQHCLGLEPKGQY